MRLIFTSLGTYGHRYPLLPPAPPGTASRSSPAADFGHVPAGAGLLVEAAGSSVPDAVAAAFAARDAPVGRSDDGGGRRTAALLAMAWPG